MDITDELTIFVANKDMTIMKRNYSNFNNYCVRYLFIAIMLLLPSITYSIDRRHNLYDIDDTTRFETIKSYLLSSGFKGNKYMSHRDEGVDTFVVYEEVEDHKNVVTIVYSPRTHTPSSYRYTWNLFFDKNDNYTPIISDTKLKGDKLFYKQCELYWTNVFNDLQTKYGKPTSVMLNEWTNSSQINRFLSDKEQLDTLQIPKLTRFFRHFEVYWENDKRKVSLAYQEGGFSTTSIEYVFLNKENHKLLIKETKFMSILIRTLSVLAFVLVIGLLGYYIHKKGIEKEEKKEQMLLEQQRIYALRRQEEEEKRKIEILKHEQLALEYNSFITKMSNDYGSCDRIIRIVPETVNPYQAILVYSESKHIIIGKKAFAFSDILDCIVNDEIKEKDTISSYDKNRWWQHVNTGGRRWNAFG